MSLEDLQMAHACFLPLQVRGRGVLPQRKVRTLHLVQAVIKVVVLLKVKVKVFLVKVLLVVFKVV
ncbi:MAG: hypothetical protein Q8755_03100 [Candidatus Phytoplasma australasiaticum]|nr:hypothetical protein [Candidatus Phytoplasma australasiaticum]